MNSMIGKSTGIALLMAAALLAALFAMGVFSPTGVRAQMLLTPSDVAYSNTSTDGSASDVTIAFKLSDDGVVGDTVNFGLRGYNISAAAIDDDGGTAGTQLEVAITDADTDAGGAALTPASYATVNADGTVTVEFAAAVESTDDTGNATGDGNIRVTIPTADLDAFTTGDAEVNCLGQTYWALDSTATLDAASLPLETKNLSSCEPGAPVRIDVYDTATAEIPANQDIVVELNANPLRKFSVPSTLSESGVLIVVGGNASIPQEVSVGANNVINITLGDSNPATVAPDPIALGAAYSIVFKQSAGISNPAGAGAAAVKITGGGTSVTHDATIQRVVKRDVASGKRGAEVTATLKGFSNGTAAVFVNGTEVGQAEVASNVGTIALNTSSGAFDAGPNSITATDATGTVQDVAATFAILPTVTLSPTETAVAKLVTVTLSDWTAGDIITNVSIGAVGATPATLPTVVASGAAKGTAEFTISVPSTVNRGTQTLRVTGTDPDGTGPMTAPSSTASLKIDVLPLSIQPASAVPGQEITITGTGFMGGDVIRAVSIGGQPVNLVTPVTASSAGNIVLTTMPPSLTSGMKTVKVQAVKNSVDTSNSDRIAEGKLEISEASISLDPAESRRESSVNVTGSGFPARTQVQIDYAGTVVVSVPSDSAGVISGSFRVPTTANIGAPHTVSAMSQSNVYTTVSTMTTHRTPGALIKLSADQISRGAQLTISGENFPVFSSVAVMTIGDQDVRPVPAPATSANGDFSATVLVPGLSLGNQTVRVKVQDTDITDFIQIVQTTTSSDPADVFASVVATGRLSRVWFLDAANQEWLFYDPDPEVADFNDLNEVTAGKAYIIIVTEGDPVEFQGRSLYQGTNNIPLR